MRTAWNVISIVRWVPGKWLYLIDKELLNLVLKTAFRRLASGCRYQNGFTPPAQFVL